MCVLLEQSLLLRQIERMCWTIKATDLKFLINQLVVVTPTVFSFVNPSLLACLCVTFLETQSLNLGGY